MGQVIPNRHPVLKMPLDLSQAVDREVYDALKGCQSGVETKNFVCSAILYYLRSPLVLSVNALCDRLDKIDFEKINYIELLLEKLSAKLDSASIVNVSDNGVNREEVVGVVNSKLDSATKTALTSLKEKFKV